MKKKACKLLAAGLAFALALSACSSQPPASSAAQAAGKYKAGTYSATVTGMHEMTVEVTFSEDAITDIVVDHTETQGIGAPAAESLPAQIIEHQSLGLDGVSGATLTSNAILEGVADCVQQAGGDVEALKAVRPEIAQEEDQTIEVDVAVIGAGGAGMAAAVSANQAGANVLVIEKTSQMGGNTILSGGAFNAVEDGSEMAASTNDSTDFHFQQTYEGGDKQANPDLVRILVDNAWSAVEWLEDLGMEFDDTPVTVAGGLWQRGQKPLEPEGTGFFIAYQKYLDEHEGIDVLYNTTAQELIVEDGVVTGVVCEGQTGNTVTVMAKNGVVLATGGFGNNREMVNEALAGTDKWPELTDVVKTTNTSAITGDGLRMAEAVGANLIQLENIQFLPLGDPETGSLSGNIGHGPVSFIFVNLDGNRFTDEGGRRDDMTLDLFEQQETTMFMIMDSDTYPNGDELNNFGEHIDDLVAAGRAYKADTIEELAEMIGVPADNLVATIDEYNRYCIGGDLEGEADAFGRTLFADVNGINDGINDGPFYAAERVPTVHHTMGGVEINTETQVLNTEGDTIPGLFAAGEVTGGIHGTNRLGGNALTDTIVFGRIAGANAAAGMR